MNTRYLFGIIAAIVVLVIIFFVYNHYSNNEVADQSDITNTEQTENIDSNENMNTEPVNTNTAPTPADTPNPATGEPMAPQDPDIAVFEIVYNGTTFAPANLTIKNGDVVIFKNESNASFWPASGPHPQHTDYPEFDPKKAIAAGQDWQFKFTKSGTWSFHNHLNSSASGRIVVQ